MRSTSCLIDFTNNPSRVFYGGQLLSGIVTLKLIKPKTVRGIYVKIVGAAYCRWSTGSGKNNKVHVGEEFYLNEKKFFVGGDSGEVVLSPNEYNYTFSCMLPPALPTSVEGKIGYIRYSVVVHIDRPLWSDQRFQEYFTVLKTLNLNNDVMLRFPLVREERKTYFKCCLLCCCTTGPLSITACIPVGGYVPGQTIELFLQINNRSDQTFENFIIHIIKNIQYHTHANSSSTKFDNIVVKTAICNGCRKNESKAYTLSIVVPPVPPTDESTSNIVKVSYRLKIRGSADCFREDPVLIFPITIGTYPILLNNTPATIPSQPQSTVYSCQTFTPCVPYPTVSSFSSDADGLDPPTYEEAISNSLDGTGFRPSYPVFRRTPSYTTKPSL